MSGAWIRRRAPALVCGAVAVAGAVVFLAEWNRISGGGDSWYVPGDLRGTVLAASNYLHGHFASVYRPETGLVSLPGVLVLLAPGLMVADLLHPGLSHGPAVVTVGGPAWLPIELVSVLTVPVLLVAADALAERLGVPRSRRAFLAVAEMVAAWGVVVWWGHPEDVLAVALLMLAVAVLLDGRTNGAAWLLGLGVAVQPVVLVAVGLMVARRPAAELRPFVGRIAVVPAALLAPVLVADWHATLHTLSQQPNFPTVDHPTPWASWSLVAPGIGHEVLAAGPLRLAAVLSSVEVGLWWGRRHNVGPGGLVAGLALCLAVRVLVEPVMVAYYVWPVLAMALVAVAARPGVWRLPAAAAVATFATVFGTAGPGPDWAWWLLELSSTGVVVLLAAHPLAPHHARGSAADERSFLPTIHGALSGQSPA